MSLGSDLRLVTRDGPASTPERAPRQLPDWDKECSTQGLVPEAECGHRSSLNQLHPLQTCQQVEMSSSAPGAVPLPGPRQAPSLEQGCSGHASVWGGLQAGQRPHSGINHNIYCICRGNGSGDTRPRRVPWSLQRDGSLGSWNSYSRAAGLGR